MQFTDKIKNFEAAHAQLLVTATFKQLLNLKPLFCVFFFSASQTAIRSRLLLPPLLLLMLQVQ
jgi:hypothetical protein